MEGKIVSDVQCILPINQFGCLNSEADPALSTFCYNGRAPDAGYSDSPWKPVFHFFFSNLYELEIIA